MLKALYYPHTDITNETILKNALLLWDGVETIVPRKNWKPRRVSSRPLINEAVDLIVSSRVPSDSERHAAHESIDRAIRDGVLTAIIKSSSEFKHRREYLIYPEKFVSETWRALGEQGIARWVDNASDYGVPPAVGFFMMSLLADACAGTQLQKITDRAEAYEWLAEHHAKILGSQNVKGIDGGLIAPSLDRLVALSLNVLDAREIPLKKLIAFRKREMRSGGSDYSAMRQRYLKTLQAHLKRIGTEATSSSDVKELERQFKEDLKQDLNDLKYELSIASVKTLFSKDVALTTLVTAGCLIAPVAGVTALSTQIGAIGVIPLLHAAVEFRGARRAALQKHSASWLYLASRAKLQVR
ncbi:MAG TPA: hypothetical protein VF471_07770 [Pseudoxanthomonas sp.]